MTIKSIIKRALSCTGYEIHRINDKLGQDAFRDMQRFVAPRHCPVIFDVGANVGQSIDLFRRHFGCPVIHAFEPSHETFRELERRTGALSDVHLNNCALGSRSAVFDFIENSCSLLSSFLEPGADCWGSIKKRHPIPVRSLDDYCEERGITEIDILKSDTQGFELEVLKGARRLLALKCIRLIYLEITFSEMYKNLPRLDEIYGFLFERDFRLVSFYQFNYQRNRAGWTDGLFVNACYDHHQEILRRNTEIKDPDAAPAGRS
jgi:FkbM family methyltransferase